MTTTPEPTTTGAINARQTAVHCACAHNTDASTTTFLCPDHADTDPCQTKADVTGRRRKGGIVNGVCSSCGWSSSNSAGHRAAVSSRAEHLIRRIENAPDFGYDDEAVELSALLAKDGLQWVFGTGDRIKVITDAQKATIEQLGPDRSTRIHAIDTLVDARTPA